MLYYYNIFIKSTLYHEKNCDLCYFLYMKKYIPLALLVAIIFISSSQSYEQQSIVPTLQQLLPNQPLYGFLSQFKIPYWGITVSVEERGYYYFLEFLIRKAAHLLSFGAIAIALYIALHCIQENGVISMRLLLHFHLQQQMNFINPLLLDVLRQCRMYG